MLAKPNHESWTVDQLENLVHAIEKWTQEDIHNSMINQLHYSNPPTKGNESELGMRHQVLVLRPSQEEPDCQED
jgi:hypothetical protein